MEDNDLVMYLEEIKKGNSDAMEQFIAEHRPFIIREASRICRRYLAWGKDEELSIALIAFNEAIDTYKERQGSFIAFARMVMKRRLIDYFRKNSNLEAAAPLMESVSVEEDFEQNQREEEIVKYQKLLESFGLDFEIVAENSPKHKETRAVLRRCAGILASRSELMDYLYKHGKIPKKELGRLAGTTPRVLERGRIYIMALALLIAEDNFPHLKDYVGVLTGEGGSI